MWTSYYSYYHNIAFFLSVHPFEQTSHFLRIHGCSNERVKSVSRKSWTYLFFFSVIYLLRNSSAVTHAPTDMQYWLTSEWWSVVRKCAFLSWNVVDATAEECLISLLWNDIVSVVFSSKKRLFTRVIFVGLDFIFNLFHTASYHGSVCIVIWLTLINYYY